jgi:hypothetical protein
MKVKIVNLSNVGHIILKWNNFGSKFPKKSFFETFYIAIGHLVFGTFIHLMYISTWNVYGKNNNKRKSSPNKKQTIDWFKGKIL